MKYKNMKIEINESQPLDDVVMELERLGYKKDLVKGKSWILCHEFGFYSCHSHDYGFPNKTTLNELKAMTNDQTRPNRSNNPAAFRNCNYLCRSVD